MSEVIRIFVEKKDGFNVLAKQTLWDIRHNLGMKSVEDLRYIVRYDLEGLTKEEYDKAKTIVLSEPNADVIYEETLPIEDGWKVFAMEYLPGQYDQRGDSAEQCVQLLTQGERCKVLTARVIALKGNITDEELVKVEEYLINPVESRLASLEKPKTLDMEIPVPENVKRVEGFNGWNDDEMQKYYDSMGFAMTLADLKFCRDYFRDTEHRDPSVTELRVIDTYWSDHCRHTTFLTRLEEIEIEKSALGKVIEDALSEYYATRDEVYGKDTKRIVSLMDMALIGMKSLKKKGLIPDLDESEEINACSIQVPVTIDGKTEQWLVQFKNETHNHPTEIEPFGGAATCLGGAIRDPLSGRSYVYQAMRVTGSGDPTIPFKDTMHGKLPSRKITTGAAQGYSSYGNQIGLATGHVAEIYDPGYMAKRMEIGAVIGAAPAENVVRERPVPGDIIILLGGRTGRDGCGGATGSSKSHSVESLETCGAEVQKGNAPEERKLQRLFRDKNATKLIKRCNDFGAGGVSVAIGELADGLEIDLNAVPKKYDGLDGTELAISESQERMAVVVDKNDVDKFIALAGKENLEATPVAVVTENPRLKMNWNGKTICDISREFLNSNGAEKHTDIYVPAPTVSYSTGRHNTKEEWEKLVTDLNVCSQKGLVQRFDSTIGAGTVLMPYSGKTQQTPVQAMAAKLPVLSGNTKTASIMAWGFDPFVSRQSPYHAAALAVVESMAKVVAAGGKSEKCWLTFQEYFERTQGDPERWGKPFAALLGAYKAQIALSSGAIGGKDSMSGTFEHIDVPPTLVSFAVSTAKSDKIISAEFKLPCSDIYYIAPAYDENGMPDFDSVKKVFATVEKAIADGTALSVWTLAHGGIAEGIFKMSLGNRIGAKLKAMDDEKLFGLHYGAFIIEAKGAIEGAELIGETVSDYTITAGDVKLDIADLEKKYDAVLEPIFKNSLPEMPRPVSVAYDKGCDLLINKAPGTIAKPKVLIPVFPGTNCEYDMAAAFNRYGGEAEIFVIRNLSAKNMEDSVNEFAKRIENSQMIAVPGGFSGGDEPEGSAKFINAFFRNPKIKDAVENMLYARDGLMIGICNGFQALIKLGLVPFGKIVPLSSESPTLTYNTIGRHQSQLALTKICTNKSPWLMHCKVGEVYNIPISHGEGRFVASDEVIAKLIENGQIATQYVDLNGEPTMALAYNPNSSMCAIEGIISPDGRVLGKMGHTERISSDTCVNVDGNKEQLLFKGGVDYFRI